MIEDLQVGGANEKDILECPDTGLRYIAKLGGRNNDLEVMTEYAIHLIGRSLGVRVANARLATFNGRLRFLSEYFLDSSAPEELIHGMQLFSELYDEETIKAVLQREDQEQAMFSVQAIKSAFGAHYYHYGAQVEDRLFAGFVAMLTHDALIGVQDRHHENWGVIVQRGFSAPEPRFAPLYDSARGLFCNVPDTELRRKFSGRAGEQRLDGYVGRSRPLVGYEGLKPKAGRRCVTHEQLVAAVFWGFPEHRVVIEQVLGAYDWRRVRSIIRAEIGHMCSPLRLATILTCLRRRLRSIRKAISAPLPGTPVYS